MATVTIRNLDEATVEALKAQAQANNRSLEAELREVLADIAARNRRQQWFYEEAERIAAMTLDVPQTDSADLLREDRER